MLVRPWSFAAVWFREIARSAISIPMTLASGWWPATAKATSPLPAVAGPVLLDEVGHHGDVQVGEEGGPGTAVNAAADPFRLPDQFGDADQAAWVVGQNTLHKSLTYGTESDPLCLLEIPYAAEILAFGRIGVRSGHV